ncbi:MAG: FAD:protein FMN transferase [Planctomycetia bacterium]|nr:FAD:protein FMN transferase [Planctomycetia bacterium]
MFRFRIIFGWIVCVVLIASPLLCAEMTQFSGETMGTQWNASVVTPKPLSDEEKEEAQNAVERALKGVDFRMSTWQNFTELSRLNQSNESENKISTELAKVLRAALAISQKTDGAYDITSGALVNLWKFGPTREDQTLPDFPSDDEIAQAKKKVDFRSLDIIENSDGDLIIKRQLPGVYIDLSSIAKGYGADCAADGLRELGYSNFMVEVGGEVVARGTNLWGEPWRLGIEKPVPGATSLYGAVELNDCALATSGDYRNFRMNADKRLSHIVDPRTGRPTEHTLVSVSVLADSCMAADGWATALMVLGPEEGQKIAKRENISALFLVQNGDKIESHAVNFPLVPLDRLEARAPSANASGSRLVAQILVSVLVFCLCFVAIGYSHFTGRRKMLCSCRAAKVMEKEREQLIRSIRNIEESEDDTKHFRS